MSTSGGVIHPELREHRGNYGFDGSLVGLCSIGAAGLTFVLLASVHRRAGRRRLAAVHLSGGLALLVTAASYLHATRRGKFVVWGELLDGLGPRDEELALDMGCGRGAILAMVAKAIPGGRAVGLDLWTADQSDNRPENTLRNLSAEGVRERCALVTGDMTAMPFVDSSFDLVLSSLAIHNVDELQRRSARRLHAIDEAVRVLKPGRRLMIVDLMWASAYTEHLRHLGMRDVQQRSLGWRLWFGPGPWAGAKLVTATKPLAPDG